MVDIMEPLQVQSIMRHAMLWEDEFGQQVESSLKLKRVLESIKSENLTVWMKKPRPKRK